MLSVFDHFVKLALKGLRPHFRFQFCKVLQRMYRKINWFLHSRYQGIYQSHGLTPYLINSAAFSLPLKFIPMHNNYSSNSKMWYNNYRHAVCIQKSLYYISINFWGSERFWRIILGKQDRNITYWIRYKCSTSILKRITIFLNTIIRKGLLTTHFKTIPTITRLAPPFLKIAHSPP